MIAESLNMSVGSVFTIMTEDLKKKKLCARFVPHTLTTEQKEHRIASSEDLIAAADEDPNFLKTIVTGDESWCLEYDPETRRQSSEWTSPGKGRPMKVRASKSKTKTMLLVFFDSRGIIHHEFLRQGSTVTGAFYKDVLHRLLKRMRRIPPLETFVLNFMQTSLLVLNISSNLQTFDSINGNQEIKYCSFITLGKEFPSLPYSQ
ncbi:histone-lysine N-methyltransferase SETMAR [Nephila pilipes]|uniref:Histone-lysine N-methyltransferase SETMAR n=1 Tax=Nephila pilipes TaxID=299642 RepID=A0A8X6QP55_NEPPI|nr:histone-lysine N-methyltransferase SETMAR [Nephila pilipes]